MCILSLDIQRDNGKIVENNYVHIHNATDYHQAKFHSNIDYLQNIECEVVLIIDFQPNLNVIIPEIC